ncbi:hypothetical protein CHUAL_002586 [Chamberlinius hualienensis]
MGNQVTKDCFESVLCKNKVKPLSRTSSTAKASIATDPNSKQGLQQLTTTTLPTFGEVIDYDTGSLQQQPTQRIAWDAPKEFLSGTVNTISEKGQEAIEELIVEPIKETVTSKWKLLNLESERKVPAVEPPPSPGLLHPDRCNEIN